MNTKQTRKLKIRTKLKRNLDKPRLSVFRSNKYVYAQIIDDAKAKTIVGVSEKDLLLKEKVSKTDRSKQLGVLIAKKAIEKKVEKSIAEILE